MTASPDKDQNVPKLSGFTSHAGARAASTAAPATAREAEAEAEPAADQNAAPVMAGFSTKRRTDKKNGALVPLQDQFHDAQFLAMLAKLYEVNEIEKDIAAKLSGFKLDASKGDQSLNDGTLYAQYGDAAVAITTSSVLTEAEMTPELAYKMAAAAAANPKVGKLTLEGTDDDKIMLFLAAQHLGLEIEESSIPEIPKNMEKLAQAFNKFEQENGLKSIAAEYLKPQQAQPKPEKATAKPSASMGAFAPA